MGDEKETSVCSFTSAMTLSKSGMNFVPRNYVLPRPQRPTLDHRLLCLTRALPVIDLSSLGNPSLRPRLAEEVRVACKEIGIFQVINHGIPVSFTNEALHVAAEFFDLTNEKKMINASSDVLEPVWYATSLDNVKDKVRYYRNFIKHYAHPLSTWINMWPSDPQVSNLYSPCELLCDQMEVMTNGRYKSVLHRATLNPAMKRLSVASLHSLAMDEKARPTPELVNEQNPLSYKKTSFGDFLNFISDKDGVGGRYLDTLKVNAEI